MPCMIDPSCPFRLKPRWNHTPLLRLIPQWKRVRLDTRHDPRYHIVVIRSFKDKRSEAIFRGEFVKGVEGKIQQRAREKLKYLDAAATLSDLRVLPGNQLEAFKGDRKGQYSVRVNQQWRLCFRWNEGDAVAVEIVDYH